MKGIRLINDYLSERIYHFNFYREFFDLIDSAPEEYELDYNQLLSIATLDTVFYTDKLPEISGVPGPCTNRLPERRI